MMAQILAFGDSITDGAYDPRGGWADRLKQYFSEINYSSDVVNAESHWFYNLGISGNLSQDILDRIEIESLARKVHKPDKRSVFIFAVGVNDSCLKGVHDPQPRCSESNFKNNYSRLISYAQQYTEKIICVGLLPVEETKVNPIFSEYWYKNERIKQFNGIIQELAHQQQFCFIDLYEQMTSENQKKSLYIDGLHPNESGHEWMYDQIKPKVIEQLR